MKFEWDESDNKKNIKKYGIDFADVARIFDGPTVMYEGKPFSGDDDDDDFETTEDDFARAISVPAGKSEIGHEFMDCRKKLAARHPCVGSDGIDYRYLKPDAEFWREATLENIDEAMDRLVVRRREEVRSGSADSHKE